MRPYSEGITPDGVSIDWRPNAPGRLKFTARRGDAVGHGETNDEARRSLERVEAEIRKYGPPFRSLEDHASGGLM